MYLQIPNIFLLRKISNAHFLGEKATCKYGISMFKLHFSFCRWKYSLKIRLTCVRQVNAIVKIVIHKYMHKYACNTNNNTHKIWENMMLSDWSLRWWILLKISRFTSASAAASKKFSPYTWQGSCWRYWWWSLHYWLRRPLGVWRVQKVVQSRHLFLIH